MTRSLGALRPPFGPLGLLLANEAIRKVQRLQDLVTHGHTYIRRNWGFWEMIFLDNHQVCGGVIFFNKVFFENHPIDQHMRRTKPSPNSCLAAFVIDWAPSAIRTLEQLH